MTAFGPMPKELGTLDKNVFRALHAEYPQTLARIELHNGELIDPRDSIASRILDIARPLYRRYTQEFGQRGSSVLIMDTHDVRSHRAQRQITSKFHIDDAPGVTVSDNLPTEFLVEGDGKQPLTNDQKELRQAIDTELKNRRQIIMDDDVLAAAGLNIYRPKPNRIVTITKAHVHRSAANPEDRAVARGWLRISKMDS